MFRRRRALLDVDPRRIARRRLGHSGEQGRFGKGEPFDRFAEIGAGGRLHPIGPTSEIDLVQVEFQDFVLGISTFDLERQQRFAQFAKQGFAGGEKQGLGQLLGDRTGPFHESAGKDVPRNGSEDAPEIHAAVLEELSVLGGDQCIDQMPRNPTQRNRIPLHGEQFGNQRSVDGVDAGNRPRFEGLKGPDLGKITEKGEHASCHRAA